jgi:hypothetical protein
MKISRHRMHIGVSAPGIGAGQMLKRVPANLQDVSYFLLSASAWIRVISLAS